MRKGLGWGIAATTGCLLMLCGGGLLLYAASSLVFTFDGALSKIGPSAALRKTTGLILPNVEYLDANIRERDARPWQVEIMWHQT